MIIKIEKIKSIGNYDNFEARGDITFKKATFIYAENGAGKTTLTSILRSLNSKNDELILKRKRVNMRATDKQEVLIKDENRTYQFQNNKWNRHKENLEIFDTFFVNENVYSGFDINSEHKKGLYKFIIGQDGIEIKNKILRTKQLIEELQSTSRTSESEIIRIALNNDVNAIIALENDDNIDSKIIEKNKELQIANSNDLILKTSSVNQVDSISFEFDHIQMKSILSLTIEDFQENFLKTITEKLVDLRKHGLENSEKWIYQGFSVIKDTNEGNCPFCNQNLLNAKDIIHSYNSYFSEKYKNLTESINAINKIFSDYNIQLVTQKHETNYMTVLNQIQSWSSFLDIIQLEQMNLAIEDFKIKFAVLKDIVQKKVNEPLSSFDITPVIELETSISTINRLITTNNERIKAFNERIVSLKEGLRSKNVVETELKSLQLQKRRYESPLKDICNKYEIINNRILRLQIINKNLQQEQKGLSSSLFADYGAKINYYLDNVFGTKFRIEQTRDIGYKGKSKEPSIEYVLTFNGIEMGLNDTDQLSIKHSLSEGDKNTIAFAFFLSKLDLDTLLNQKVIVFDDPLSSLDVNRRNKTIHQLVSIKNRAKQLIVLSHNLYFLIELNSISQIRSNEKKILRITHNHSIGTSNIVEYELKKDWINSYEKGLNSLDDFLQNPTDDLLEDALSNVRLVLESYLKFKFCKFIPDLNQTFGTIISVLNSNANCIFVDTDKTKVIDDLNELNAISWRAHHAIFEENETITERHIQSSELETQYIPLTTELIYRRL